MVEISFKDMLGRTTTVLSREQSAGHYAIGLNKYNLAPGRYIVNIKSAGVEKNATIVLTK